MERTKFIVRLELTVEDGYISGRATDGDGAGREFTGWVGLTGAIDALVAEAAERLPEAHLNGGERK
jgi:hypothetical protein